jgi:WD40 repeat protein
MAFTQVSKRTGSALARSFCLPASSGCDRTVKVWDAMSGQETLTLKGHNDPVMSLEFSPDGKWLASRSGDQTLKVWDAQPHPEASTPEANARW